MEITLQELNDARQAIIAMAQCKFDANTSRALQLNLRRILECAPAYQQAHDRIYQDNGSPVTGTPEFEKYTSDFKDEVNHTGVEIVFQNIRLEDLNVEENKILLGVILALDPMLTEPADQN